MPEVSAGTNENFHNTEVSVLSSLTYEKMPEVSARTNENFHNNGVSVLSSLTYEKMLQVAVGTNKNVHMSVKQGIRIKWVSNTGVSILRGCP